MVHTPFGSLPAALAVVGVTGVDGIVFDLGVSSFQLDQRERGFSFQADGPLDMRMAQNGPTAADLVNGLEEAELARLLYRYGDEQQARAIAHTIVETRQIAPITTTGELAALVARAKGGRQGPRDPATRTFQALRMIVNDEVGELERGLTAAERLLRASGRLVVVSFHSGEDTQVKRFVNQQGGRQAQPSRHLPPVKMPAARWRWVRQGVIKPSAAEIAANPRARSARLRVAERLTASDRSGAHLGEEESSPWRRAA
jgi:16S rRNA (cytosine1402-N4)-methyltransferase